MLYEVLADIAGVAGFALSLWIVLFGWFQRREAFKVTVLDYSDLPSSVRFFLLIRNESNSPLVITEIKYLGTTCELEPKKIRGEPGSWNAVSSARFPVRVRPHDAELLYIEVVGCEYIPLAPDTWVSFQIQTISRSAQKTALLGNKSRYLNKMG